MELDCQLPMATCNEDTSSGLEAIRKRSELASKLLLQAQKLRLGRNVSSMAIVPGLVFSDIATVEYIYYDAEMYDAVLSGRRCSEN